MEVIGNKCRLTQFRSRLAMAENLFELVTAPPTILIDEKQNLFFYQGYPAHLAPTTFKLMALMAKRPGEVITRDEIYARLWPDFSNTGNSSNPYDRQISDHKRRITFQIQKSLNEKIEISTDKIKELIKTIRKIGYVFNLRNEEVFFLD